MLFYTWIDKIERIFFPHKATVTFNATKTSYTCQKWTLISEKSVTYKIIYALLERQKKGRLWSWVLCNGSETEKCKQIKNRSNNTVQLCLMADNVGDKYCNMFCLLIWKDHK